MLFLKSNYTYIMVQFLAPLCCEAVVFSYVDLFFVLLSCVVRPSVLRLGEKEIFDLRNI